jgi:hypothetical protein
MALCPDGHTLLSGAACPLHSSLTEHDPARKLEFWKRDRYPAPSQKRSPALRFSIGLLR